MLKRYTPFPILKCCVFSTANDSYLPNALVSLLSFTKYNKDFDMFILCSNLSAENSNLCAYCGVIPVEIDLSDTFYQEWEYPKECFYHFRAPELFFSKGYDYSVYIDGDTYCSGRFHWDPAVSFHIAGSSNDTISNFFLELGDYENIKRVLGLTDEGLFHQDRLQSGVLVYNNSALHHINYFSKAAYIYDRSIKVGIPRKGDDSLLALMLAFYPEIKTLTLSSFHNFIDYRVDEIPNVDSDGKFISQCIVYHFINHKPWHISEYYTNYPHKYFAQKWLEVMINNFNQEDIERCYPEFYKADIIDSSQVKFYWFKAQPNFGDWITPYLVKRICGLEVTSVDPLETEDDVIISTGSIMRLCGANTIVWGSGIRDRYQDIMPGKLVRSTRGPITRIRVLEVGGECPPIYGDPALLLPRFYNPQISVRKYRLGIAPHISQYERVRNLYADEADVIVIDLRTKNIEAVVDKFLECDAIVSSSLHGIIVANAYDIPVRWIQFDTNIFGDNTKFYDHFASIRRLKESFIDALGYRKLPVEYLLEQIEPYKMEVDLDKLWDAAVFDKGEVSKYIRYVMTPDSKLSLLSETESYRAAYPNMTHKMEPY